MIHMAIVLGSIVHGRVSPKPSLVSVVVIVVNSFSNRVEAVVLVHSMNQTEMGVVSKAPRWVCFDGLIRILAECYYFFAGNDYVSTVGNSFPCGVNGIGWGLSKYRWVRPGPESVIVLMFLGGRTNKIVNWGCELSGTRTEFISDITYNQNRKSSGSFGGVLGYAQWCNQLPIIGLCKGHTE